MRTLLNEAAEIEQYLFKTGPAEDRLLFEARLLIDPALESKMIAQHQVYGLVKHYGRRQLKAELEGVHQKLFTQPQHRSFAQKIRKLFGNG